MLHPVSDLATAKAVYTALLGVPPQTDESYYVGFEAAGQHIGLVPGGGPQGMTSPVAYWHVPDIEAKLAEVTAAGATVKEPAHDVGGGRLVAPTPRRPPTPQSSPPWERACIRHLARTLGDLEVGSNVGDDLWREAASRSRWQRLGGCLVRRRQPSTRLE